MAEKVVEQGQVADVNVAVAQDRAAPAVAPETGQNQAQVAPAAKPWQETLDEIARTVPAEELRRHPLVNDHAQSIAAKQRNEEVARERAKQAQVDEATAFEQRLNALPPDQRFQALTIPENAEYHAKAVRILQAGSISAVAMEALRQEAHEDFERMVDEDDDFRKVNKAERDKVLALPKVGQAQFALAKLATAEERKQIMKDMDARVDAKIHEWETKFFENSPEGEAVQAGVVGGANGSADAAFLRDYADGRSDDHARYAKLRKQFTN